MILHPGVISLLVGSGIVILMILYSSLLGLKILKKWDIISSSSEQLYLERKTYLLSTIMNYVLGFEILSALLFIYTVDDIHRIFVGAMCATGSLNANPVGWNVLYTKIAILFLSSTWIALNYMDQRAEDYPLVRFKYKMLLFMAPLIAMDAYFQTSYFLGLKPDIITSCCGALFSEGSSGIASSLSSLPLKPMMYLFYICIFLFLIFALLSIKYESSIFRYGLCLISFMLFPVSIASIVSFISLYFYELPTHHCPFDILQKGYYFIGYPIYGTLFSGVFFGMITGLFDPLKKIGSLKGFIHKLQKRWTMLSILFILIFVAITSWPIIFSSFTLEGYF